MSSLPAVFVNKQPAERPPLDAGTRAIVRHAFRDDVVRLELLLGRDLSHRT